MMPNGPPTPSVAPPPTGTTVWGANDLRAALGRFRILVSLALAIAVLLLLERLLTAAGLLSFHLPPDPIPISQLWVYGLELGAVAAIGVAVAVLVIIAIVVAVRGLITWRKGVREMEQGADDYGPEHASAARRARADHSRTLWLFLAYLVVAIAVSVAMAATNYTLNAVGDVSLPGFAASVVTGLATGGVLIAIYYYGSRQIVGFLYGIALYPERTLLSRGRDLLLVGAVVGLGAALNSVYWAFDLLAVASLALILLGARDLYAAYSAWVAGNRPSDLFAPRPAAT